MKKLSTLLDTVLDIKVKLDLLEKRQANMRNKLDKVVETLDNLVNYQSIKHDEVMGILNSLVKLLKSKGMDNVTVVKFVVKVHNLIIKLYEVS